MSSFPWLRKGSKTSNGLKRVPIKSAPFTEFHIPSSPGPLSAITTLFLGGKKSQIFFCQWHQCTSLRSIYSTHCRILGGCSCRFSALKGKNQPSVHSFPHEPWQRTPSPSSWHCGCLRGLLVFQSKLCLCRFSPCCAGFPRYHVSLGDPG